MKQAVNKTFFKTTLTMTAILLAGCASETTSQQSPCGYVQPTEPCSYTQTAFPETLTVDRVEVQEIIIEDPSAIRFKNRPVSASTPGLEERVVPVKQPQVKKAPEPKPVPPVEVKRKPEVPVEPAPVVAPVVPEKPIVIEETVVVEEVVAPVPPAVVEKPAPMAEPPAAEESPDGYVKEIKIKQAVIGEPVKELREEPPLVIEETVVEETVVEEKGPTQAEIDAQKARLKAEMEALKKQQTDLEAEKARIEKMRAEAKACDEVKDWVAAEGTTLRTLLTEWGDQSGWRVIWNMDRDYTLEAGAVFRGRFLDVSAALLRSFARATPAPKGVFYKGNKVLVVSTREDENAE